MLYDEIESCSEKFLMSQKFTMVGCHGFSSATLMRAGAEIVSGSWHEK